MSTCTLPNKSVARKMPIVLSILIPIINLFAHVIAQLHTLTLIDQILTHIYNIGEEECVT